MNFGRNAGTQNAKQLESGRRGKVAVDFQRLTLSSREHEELEPGTSKATGFGPSIHPVKVGASTTIKELQAAQAQTDDYGLITSTVLLDGPGSVLRTTARGPKESSRALKSSVLISR